MVNHHALLNSIRLIVGLPLLGSACQPAAASGSNAIEPAQCGSIVEVTPLNRASIVAAFAGDQSLGVPILDTKAQREEWVSSCLVSRADWPARCDLRTVVPLDPAWWDELPDVPVTKRHPVSLHWYFDKEDHPPCTRNTLVWSLVEELPVPDEDRTRGTLSRSQGIQFDARTGESRGISHGFGFSGRPFDGRLAACSVDGGGGRSWVERAREEHASVAAFARHALELMALGAPLELLDAVTQAQADEVRHTRMCVERAGAYGADLALGPLDTVVPRRRSAFLVAMGVALEGCVNETVSALELLNEARRADDEADRRVLELIAADEVVHATLAWRTLEWLVPQLTRRERRQVRRAMLRALPVEWAADLTPCVNAAA